MVAVTQLSPSIAEGFDPGKWNGTQLQFNVGALVPVAGNEDSYFTTEFAPSVSIFGIPESNTSMRFVYLGPSFSENETNWLTIAPFVGVATGWHPEGDDMLIASLWLNIASEDGEFSLFLEGDGYLHPDQQDYYGVYMFDWNMAREKYWNILNHFGLGLHAEQTNTNFTFGPHISLKRDQWSLRLDYHTGFQEATEGSAIRVVTSLMY